MASASRARAFERLERERGLPIVGKAPLRAVYAAILPLGRGLVAVGVSANAITVASLVLAATAAVLFGVGHFGTGAAVGAAAGLADAVDGIVARESRTTSRFGKILDTTVDRYVEGLLLGGIAIFVRADVFLLALCLAALVGAYMVSYASSVVREHGFAGDDGAPMRRVHRLVYLLGGALLVPFTSEMFAGRSLALQMAPLVAALTAIAIIGNVSAVRRILAAATESTASDHARHP
jgi:CDP-diacylglycerol--glycerol-3-phosphate 3-phosphatidyltransferase